MRSHENFASFYHETRDNDGEGLPDPVLLAILRALPRRQREVFLLRILLDMDTAATARELGMAQGTVKVQFSRAVAAFRERLLPRFDPEMEQYAHDW